jgi:hypothetical protein
VSLNTLALFRTLYRGNLRTLYVATTGSDSNSGLTAAAPFLTINAAITACRAGDRIVVAPGTYAPFSFYNKQGYVGAYITIEGVGASINAATNATDGAAAVDFQLCSYVAMYGFEVYGSQTMSPTSISGVAIFRSSDHIGIVGCNVHDFPSGGINCFYIQATTGANPLPAGGWDCVDLLFNTVHGTSRYDPNNTSSISIFGAADTTNGALLAGRYGYRLVGNVLYDALCLQPYTAGGFTYVTDGNAISLDSLNTATVFNAGNVPYTKFGLVEGNIGMGCGGRGCHIYNTINVDIIGNLWAGNLRTNSPAINGGVEQDATYDTNPANAAASGVTSVGNIIWPTNTPNSTDTYTTRTGDVILGGTQTVPAGCIDKRSVGAAYFAGLPTEAQLIAGLALSALVPVSPVTFSKPGTPYVLTAYQALAVGARPRSTWTVGPLEPTTPARVLVHS